jgi:hypothetical protein
VVRRSRRGCCDQSHLLRHGEALGYGSPTRGFGAWRVATCPVFGGSGDSPNWQLKFKARVAIPIDLRCSCAFNPTRVVLVSWEQGAAPPLASLALFRTLDCVHWGHGGVGGLALICPNLSVNADAWRCADSRRKSPVTFTLMTALEQCESRLSVEPVCKPP